MSSSSPNGSGITFGNYEVVAKDDGTPVLLGGGSYGKTYRAVHSFLGSTVALKVIHDSFAFDAAVKKRFLAEAKAMARLRHAHVAQILNCGEEDGTLYYAVEFCDGGDLEHVVRKLGPLKPGTVLALARQAAEALAYVHENGFLHRDLKPSNLMLATPLEGGDARLKVIDFGLVKQFDQDHGSGMTQTGQFLGTMLFASPEQLREESLDARSDIFSLGLTLWFMLKGGTPFSGKPAQVVAQRLSGKGYAADLPPDLPPPVHALLARMVSLDVEGRPKSMREVLQAIDDCAKQMAQPESPLAQLSNIGDTAADGDEDTAMGSSVHLTSVERLTGDCYALDNEQMEVDFGVRHRGRRLPSGKVVALTLVRRSLAASPVFVQHLEKTVQRASECAGPQLIRPAELVRFRDHLVLVEEWVQGLDLLTLLRQRKTISLSEALPIVRQLADACDLARDAQLAKLEIAAHRVILQFDRMPWSDLDTAAQNQLLSQPLQQWPAFTVRIAPTYTVEEKATGPSTLSQMPQLTVVGGGEQDADLASRFGRLIYRIVSGHPALATATVSRSAYVSVPGLSEESNQFLSQVIAGESHHKDCVSILEDLWRLERLSPAAFRSSAPTITPGNSRQGGTKSGRTATATRPPIAAPGRPASTLPGKVATIPVAPIEPAVAAEVPSWDMKDAKPVDNDRPRIIPLGKKAPAPLSTPVPQAPSPVVRPTPVSRPAPERPPETDFWSAPPPVAPPKPATPARKFPILPVTLASLGAIVVVGGIILLNRPAEEDEEPYAVDEVSKGPVFRKDETAKVDMPVEPPPTVTTPQAKPAPAPSQPAPIPTPTVTMTAPLTPKAEPPAPQPKAEVPKQEAPKMVEVPVPVPAPKPTPAPPPPPPADPVVELEKRYASSRSATDAKALLALLEPKLATAALADRPTLARRIGDLWKVTKADDRTLEWQLYQHFNRNSLPTEAGQALAKARTAGIKEAWVETVRLTAPSDLALRQYQQSIAENWPGDPEGKAAINWLQMNVEARIPATATPGEVMDPFRPGSLLTIPRAQWKAGGMVALPEQKRYFHLPATLPAPKAELVRSADGSILPGVVKSPTSQRRLEDQWAAWRPRAKVTIDGEVFQMPDDLPAPDLVGTGADGTAHTVRSPYGGHTVKVRETDWQAGARIADSQHDHLSFRLPSPLPEWFTTKPAELIPNRYTVVRSPYAQKNEIPVTASTWGNGEVMDPVTRQKATLPKIDDPRLSAEVIDAYNKTVRNPYTNDTESWKGTWEAGSSIKWGSSGFTYRLPSPLPSAEVETAETVNYTTVKSPYNGESVTVTEADWSAGMITPKKGRPMKLNVGKDPKLEAPIADVSERTVTNPYTNTTFQWQGAFEPGAVASWGPFTMRLPKSKSAFKEPITIPKSMQDNFKTSTGLYIAWRSSEGRFRSDRIDPSAGVDELCKVVTEDARHFNHIPMDHEFVFDGTDRLVSRRIKPTVQAKK